MKSAAEAISRGFQDNEIWVWLLPDDQIRARVERRQYQALIKHIFVPRGSGWFSTGADGEVAGAALWYPPGTRKHNFRETLAESLPFLPAGLPHLGKAAKLQRLVTSSWPKEPHWYLSVLSVSPEFQHQGYGSRLLKPGLQAADRDGLGCWLETQRESNIPFYARFGFQLLKEVEVEPGIPLWLMWRPPAG
ncbi:MAG TPA: GNAT family N-acetyltransferase [Solirubrobacterales bacterium]|nr:GNAT family N-acetyltransferase [Solirubrobacterales bacterium]